MWIVNLRLEEIRDMKWDSWQSISERLPATNKPILFIVDKTVYYGAMHASEARDSHCEPWETKRCFAAYPQIKKEECCEGNFEPIEVEMIDRLYEFKPEQVSYWIPVPIKTSEGY